MPAIIVRTSPLSTKSQDKNLLMGLFSLCSNLSMVDSVFSFYLLDFLVFSVGME
ncbi:hypothetical protein HDU91_004664, partial [Kappamyces sp. JEL0680]